MKTVKMQGGIGNQLFCLAFAHSAARLFGGSVAIDLAAFRASRYGHAFALEELALDLGNIRPVRRGPLGGRLATAIMRAKPIARAAPMAGYVSEGEPPAGATGLAALIARGRYFNGYWQNEACIACPGEFIERTRASVFRRSGAPRRREVVIHYRTYKEEMRARARRTVGADYIRAALARIEADLGRPAEICLVSDDPALALRELGDVGRAPKVVAGADAWEDMALLMTARALVLTNSSFSWWGGFCGDAEAVTYPRQLGYFHYPIPAARFSCV